VAASRVNEFTRGYKSVPGSNGHLTPNTKRAGAHPNDRRSLPALVFAARNHLTHAGDCVTACRRFAQVRHGRLGAGALRSC
jgi:hypothetical protein